MSNPHLTIPHPGYQKKNMMRSASGSMKLTPERVSLMIECGMQLHMLEEQAERIDRDIKREEYQEILDQYGLDYAKKSEYVNVAAAYGPDSGFPQDRVIHLPWRVLTLCVRKDVPTFLRREIMHLLVHWLEHPGCPNTVEGKITVVQELLDNRPFAVRQRYQELQKEIARQNRNLTWRPIVTPSEDTPERAAIPNAFSQVNSLAIQQALEAVMGQLKAAASKEQEALQEELERTRGEIARLVVELEVERASKENATRAYEELHTRFEETQRFNTDLQTALAATRAILAEKEKEISTVNSAIGGVIDAVRLATTVLHRPALSNGKLSPIEEGEEHVFDTSEGAFAQPS